MDQQHGTMWHAATHHTENDEEYPQVYDQREGQRFQLPDGRTLSSPTPVTPDGLTVGAWIAVAGRPHEVRDLRQRVGGGRIAHLTGGGIASIGPRDTVLLYTLTPASIPRRTPGAA